MASKDVLLTLVIATLALLMHSPAVVNGQFVPIFTVSFDVSREASSYNSFITSLRNRIASGSYAGGVPMLGPERNGRDTYFHLVLASGGSQITLRIRLGNLYFVAFQAASGTWYEFRPDDPNSNVHLFPGTTFLRFTGNYPPRNSDEFQLPDTIVGPGQLSNAITSLANFNPNAPNNVNRPLLMSLMVMFPEALRFRAVSDFVFARMNNIRIPDSRINDTLADQINRWGALSMEMRRSDLFATFNEISRTGITNTAQAATILGLLLWNDKVPSPPRPRFTTNALSDANVTTKGRQLVEIFWVQIINIDNENPGDLYGKIQVVDDLSTPQYIFNRTKDNYFSIGPKEFVPLTGPTRAISAYDSFYIDVSLMDYDTSSSDDEVSKGQITWNYFALSNVYDQPLSVEVKGQYGSIGVSYAVYTDAVTATVQVTLINGDNENPANVYGRLNATNTLSNGDIVLFNKKSNQYVDIKPQQLIPLLRSVVVVPLSSSIKVTADLWDQDTSSPDDPIAQGSITFAAAASGYSTGRITGKYGVIEVKVIWSSSWA